jgi:hypothetical protein
VRGASTIKGRESPFEIPPFAVFQLLTFLVMTTSKRALSSIKTVNPCLFLMVSDPEACRAACFFFSDQREKARAKRKPARGG